MKEKKYKVYYLIDPRDGLVKYVGITITSLRLRLQSHLSEARNKRNKGPKTYWIRKLMNSGLEPAIEKVYDNLTLQEACQFEIALIAIFGRLEDGGQLTNITSGGQGHLGGKPWNKRRTLATHPDDPRLLSMSKKLEFRKRKVLRYDLKGNLIDEWPSLMALHRATGLDYRLVSGIAKKKWGRKSLNGYTFCFEGGTPYTEEDVNVRPRAREVFQYDFEGNFVARYDSYLDAAQAIGGIDLCISQAARGKTVSAHGYLWRGEYLGAKIEAPANKKATMYAKDKRVVQYTLDGRFVKVHESPMAAASELKVTKSGASNIRAVMRGERGHAYGFLWRKPDQSLTAHSQGQTLLPALRSGASRAGLLTAAPQRPESFSY